MKKQILFLSIVTVLVGGGVLATRLDRGAEPSTDSGPVVAEKASVAAPSARRRFDAAALAPNIPDEERRALLEESDEIRHELEAQGEQDVGSALRSRLHDAEVSEAEARAWYAEHRELFGQRSFEQSKRSIEQLVAIAKVREELGVD